MVPGDVHSNLRTDMNKPEAVGKYIQERKTSFLTYNISRLRELIRYLSPKKRELFDVIPFLLHVNLPGLPGYLPDSEIPLGIFNFTRSGFYKRAVKHLRIDSDQLRSVPFKQYDIHGLYLMGSSGTIGQTDFSDFDYWLLVDKASLGEEKSAALRIKLAEIERWCRQDYRHSVKFFSLDIDHLRNNIFSVVDAESSGSAQKTLLKEEFYRTFILIAGRIPYWAVLPGGLKDNAYQTWMDQIAVKAKGRFTQDAFIDLGNLPAIKKEECLGALLWQMYKAKNDPVKSLIKAALISHYFFFDNHKTPLCDRVKERFSEKQLDSYSVDPYTAVFDTVVEFFNKIQDPSGLELLKSCVLLRLLGYPFTSGVGANSPKRELFNRLVQKWNWSDNKQGHFQSYENWYEQDKRDFDTKLFQKLTYLYELILRSRDQSERPFEMERSDLKTLSKEVAIWFQKKKGKLPRCSTWMRLKSGNIFLLISCRMDPAAGSIWYVHNDTPDEKADTTAAYVGHTLLEVIGWIHMNGFQDRPNASLLFQSTNCSITPKRAKKLYNDVARFFAEETPNPFENSSWDKMIVLVKGHRSMARRKQLCSVDMLIKNTSGEFYFRSLNLRSIENHLLQCYSISNVMWDYMKKVPAYALEYRIVEIDGNSRLDSAKTIQDLIGKSKKKAVQEDLKKMKIHKSVNLERGRPFLDRLGG
jgi:adenylate cyclase, class 1